MRERERETGTESRTATTATSLERFATDVGGDGDRDGRDARGDRDDRDGDRDDRTLGALRDDYRRLTFEELPDRARREGWPVVEDHCVARIVLDETVGDVWSDRVDRPAIGNLSPGQLRTAIDVARSLAAGGRERAVELNRRSLRYRGELGDVGGRDGDGDESTTGDGGKGGDSDVTDHDEVFP